LEYVRNNPEFRDEIEKGAGELATAKWYGLREEDESQHKAEDEGVDSGDSEVPLACVIRDAVGVEIDFEDLVERRCAPAATVVLRGRTLQGGGDLEDIGRGEMTR
jgi:hypothetical protein